MTSRSIRQKALNYVIGVHMKPEGFVDAWEDDTAYYGRCENPYHRGVYMMRTFPKDQYPEIEAEVKKAMAELDWIAAGNEFPTS